MAKKEENEKTLRLDFANVIAEAKAKAEEDLLKDLPKSVRKAREEAGKNMSITDNHKILF